MQTDEVIFNPLKRQRREALATVGEWADACELRIDAIEERPKRLSVDMCVRVTGNPENIDAFCRETGGRRLHEPAHTFRRWVGGISGELIQGILAHWP